MQLRGMSVSKLANLVGVTSTAVHDWRRGRSMSLEHLITVARVLGVNPSKLLDSRLHEESEMPRWPGPLSTETCLWLLRQIYPDFEATLRGYSARLTATRQALGLSQTECCEAVKLTGEDGTPDIEQWNKWEEGTMWPNLTSIMDFCDRYGVTLDWLIAGRLIRIMDEALLVKLAAWRENLPRG